MGIRFYCHACDKRLNVKSFLAGKRGICPHCGAKVEIPQTSQAKNTQPAAAAEPSPLAGGPLQGQPQSVQPQSVQRQSAQAQPAQPMMTGPPAATAAPAESAAPVSSVGGFGQNNGASSVPVRPGPTMQPAAGGRCSSGIQRSCAGRRRLGPDGAVIAARRPGRTRPAGRSDRRSARRRLVRASAFGRAVRTGFRGDSAEVDHRRPSQRRFAGVARRLGGVAERRTEVSHSRRGQPSARGLGGRSRARAGAGPTGRRGGGAQLPAAQRPAIRWQCC